MILRNLIVEDSKDPLVFSSLIDNTLVDDFFMEFEEIIIFQWTVELHLENLYISRTFCSWYTISRRYVHADRIDKDW